MSHEHDKYSALMKRLDYLLDKQNDLLAEIMNVRSEVRSMKAEDAPAPLHKEQSSPEESGPESAAKPVTPHVSPVAQDRKPQPVPTPSGKTAPGMTRKKPVAKTPRIDIESWIGQNLISKIGIAITVIGVAIGVKYSIDHNLISPVLRMVTGYLIGGGLIAIGYRLRRKFENYSAILVSGGIATLYLVTFSAYNFFDLIPQGLAFSIMLLLTVYGIYTAISYNKQVIAHIGLVGAYAVPILLSDGSGRVEVLFSYVAIINVGILVLAYRKYWTALNYSSLLITWLLYSGWLLDGYIQEEHFALALTFLTITFLTFYAMFLVYKVTRKKEFLLEDVFLLLGNSLIYYMISNLLISNYTPAEPYLGLFTLGNAFVHLLAAIIIFRQRVDQKVFYFAAGLAGTFITIAIPIQLDGTTVTLLWSLEGAVLFAIGRIRKAGFYEMFAYPLLIIAFASLLLDWRAGYDQFSFYNQEGYITPIFNIYFFSTLIFALASGTAVFLSQKCTLYGSNKLRELAEPLGVFLSVLLIVTVYNMFRLEIANAISQAYAQALIAADGMDDASPYGKVHDPYLYSLILQFAYSVVFIALLAFLNLTKLRKRALSSVTIVLHYITAGLFVLMVLYSLGELRDHFQRGLPPITIMPPYFPIYGRYLIMAIMAGSTIMARKQLLQFSKTSHLPRFFILSIHLMVLWTLSSELIHWMDLAGYDANYKLALSILWGCYALFLIIIGMKQNRKYLRISAFTLFGVTLFKVFVYDLESLNTVSRTIVFVSLGVLLLISSFLYNKYKDLLLGEEETEPLNNPAEPIPSENRLKDL
ncbi:DUF2339 domain-containing protein [Roseivirga sp. BDSF3-8]|uniref:DUF2339 domain-containing protein n=1 Tax=Roseivirga sp. BDSF3-8 TaxID=3241598 RepID=UPI00353235F4